MDTHLLLQTFTPSLFNMLIHSNPHLFHSSLEAGVSGSLSLSIKFTASCHWEVVVTWSHRVEAMTGGSEQPHKGMKETNPPEFILATNSLGLLRRWECPTPVLRHRVACSGWSPSYVHSTSPFLLSHLLSVCQTYVPISFLL